jgi:acetyltransferase-like isoleucine patch superfamily enzyme
VTAFRYTRVGVALRRLKWLLLPTRRPRCGFGCRIHPMARFDGYPDNVRLGDNVVVDAFASFYCHRDSQITIDDGTYVGDNAVIHTGKEGGSIAIGKNCSVQTFSTVYGHGGVVIGDGVRIATQCVIIPANHVYEDPHRPIHQQGITRVGIAIGDDVWLGAGVIVLDGSSIGTGSVVAAASVVRGSIGPGEVVGGIPAQLIKKRFA